MPKDHSSLRIESDLVAAPYESLRRRGIENPSFTDMIGEQGRIDHTPTTGEGLLKVPPGLLLRFGFFAALGVAVLSLYLAADHAYPHGPPLFTGEYEVVCVADGRRCREVPVYKEDTSGLNNPGWVGIVRTMGLLIVGPAVILIGIAINAGYQIYMCVRAFMRLSENRLIVLHYLWRVDEELNDFPDDLQLWDYKHLLLALLGRYQEAINVVEIWVEKSSSIFPEIDREFGEQEKQVYRSLLSPQKP